MTIVVLCMGLQPWLEIIFSLIYLLLAFVEGVKLTHLGDVLATKPRMFVKLNLTTSVQQNLSAAFASTSAGWLNTHSSLMMNSFFVSLFVPLD